MAACAHERCTCTVAAEGTFCSETCALERAGALCACGHPACGDFETSVYGDSSSSPNAQDQRDAHRGEPL
jgi:hypothetical protein